MSLVTARDLGKDYETGEVRVAALAGVSFEITPASFVSFVGPSGSGKTTLLNLIGCLDKPTNGTLTVVGSDVRQMDRHAGARFRGRHIGFIFQDFNLLPMLTVAENVVGGVFNNSDIMRLDYQSEYEATAMTDQGETYRLELKARSGAVAYDNLVMLVDKEALVPTEIECRTA